ncbi:uncharacterized protein LOC135706915 [Ochlerotatus camptorhynchus]|uniref:uncharacterized protein LOC135706915 n=1 Tax=Ochlerotatus camptorhynchus TaxID=644619 RepID=UPI0031D670EA
MINTVYPDRRHHRMFMQPASINSEQTCVIRKFAEMHDQLSDTVQLFNCCYSDHIAYILTVLLAFIIVAIFGLIHSFASSANQVTVFMSWNNLFYASLYSQLIVQMILFSSRYPRLNFQSKRTAVEIHKVSCYKTYDRRVLEELRCLSQQMWHRDPKISCSFFDLDWTLLYAV